MWRAFFIAIGIMMIIVGVECLLIESATFAATNEPAIQVNNGFFQQLETYQVRPGRTVRPPEWIPWSLLFSGAIIILYAVSLPAKGGRGGD